ncbi:MAG: hypothetical protein FJ029_12475 [Actinobacteria bacterium]|nr:hypothetical protein [Actinomycetota bacterium]
MTGCAALVLVEVYALFVNRHSTFTIHGDDDYEISEFADGSAVAHAFLMRGDGLHQVRAQLSSDRPAMARVRWTIWRGSYDQQDMTPAAEGESEVSLGRSRSWTPFPMTRDGSSKDRWYTLELQLVEVRPLSGNTRPRIAVLATHDNPDRGGVLWVAKTRRQGSMVVKADRIGRTLYRRFQMEAEPNLPAVMRYEAMQWLLMLVLHAAFFTFAYSVLSNARSDTSGPIG